MNANTISYTKFSNLINQTAVKMGKKQMDSQQLISMFNEKVYRPKYENQNSIFYFVREPGIRPFQNNVELYEHYLNSMEGNAKIITLENYCFEAILILDGSFTVPLDYNEKMQIKIGDKKIKTINKFN